MRLETERLLIRSFKHSDVPAYAEIVADARVTRYLSSGGPHSYAEAQAYVEDCIERDLETGVSRYAVLLADELIGFCGFKDVGGYVDFGWRYAHRCWGHGYATEAARAVLHFGAHTLELWPIRATAYEENAGSLRVMEKIGMSFFERTEDDRGSLVWFQYQGP